MRYFFRQFLLVVTFSYCASATSAADQFPVSDAQMKALGITLQAVDAAAPGHGPTYPAKVILPPEQETVVSAPVSGSIEQVLVEENQRVKVGQVLLRLASPEFGQLQIAALEAANKDRIARQTLERERQLLAEGIIPQRRVATAEAEAAEAQAALSQARAALRLAGLDKNAVARLIQSGELQESLQLRARRSGVVSGLEHQPGERVAVADPLLRITDASRLRLDIQIPADRAVSWSKDLPITVVGRNVTAMATNAGSVVGEGQTVSLRAQVKTGTQLLRPGEFVQVQVPFATGANTWTLPLAAVARQDGKAYVFVRTTSGFAARAVNVIASAGQTVSVAGALRPGERVAISSVIALKAAWLGESGGD
jgi:RND family efflux transporter MFP subunit